MDRASRTLLARAGRLAVLLVSAFCVLVGQVATQLHEAATPHVVCAEHEQVEDAAHVVAANDDDEGSSLTAAEVPGEEHAGCALPLTAHGGTAPLVDGRQALAPPVAELPAARAPEGAPGRTGPPLFRLAPKNSPPRA